MDKIKECAHPGQCDPVGPLDIAEAYELRPNTIHIYRMQGDLPAERWLVSRKPAWCFISDIEPWAANRRFYTKRRTQ